MIALNKKGVLKSIIKSRAVGGSAGAGKAANVPTKKKKLTRTEGAKLALAAKLAAKAEKQTVKAAGAAGAAGADKGGEDGEDKKEKRKKRKSKSRNNRP